MTECAVCHEPLNKHATVYAGIGGLVCSKQCAVEYILEKLTTAQVAEYAVEACFEEVSTEDIGVADEPTICIWCEEEFEDSELIKTDIGMLCEHCLAAIRSRGEEVIVYE